MCFNTKKSFLYVENNRFLNSILLICGHSDSIMDKVLASPKIVP